MSNKSFAVPHLITWAVVWHGSKREASEILKPEGSLEKRYFSLSFFKWICCCFLFFWACVCWATKWSMAGAVWTGAWLQASPEEKKYLSLWEENMPCLFLYSKTIHVIKGVYIACWEIFSRKLSLYFSYLLFNFATNPWAIKLGNPIKHYGQ